MSEVPGSKRCRDCGTTRPLDEFPPSARNRDGRGTYCRPCMNVRHRESRDARRSGPRKYVRNPLPVGERTSKWCSRCQQEKLLGDFGRNRSTSDGLTTYCKPCHNAAGREALARAGGSRNYHLKRRYGITAAEYDAMAEAQGGMCALCEERPVEHVDHDHKTGAVRGLLCSCCNQALGSLRDRVDLAQRAVEYLRNRSS